MALLTGAFPIRNEKLKDCWASAVAKNRTINARHSTAGMTLRNAVDCLYIFGSTNDSKCLNLSGDIHIYLGDITILRNISKLVQWLLTISTKFRFYPMYYQKASIQPRVKEHVLGNPEATIESCFVTGKCSILVQKVFKKCSKPDETLVQNNLKRR